MVKLSKPSIARFREQTRFKVVPFHTLLASFKGAKDGVIDKTTFMNAAKSIFETKQDELLDSIYDYLDLDGSGTIDAGELLCALNIFCSGNTAEKVRICFAAFDLDGNGVLSRDEFRNMLHTTLVTSRDLLVDLLGHFAEGDDPDTVETVALKTLKIDEVELMADAAFDAADTNKDGSIQLSEFQVWANAQSNMHDFFQTFDVLFGK